MTRWETHRCWTLCSLPSLPGTVQNKFLYPWFCSENSLLLRKKTGLLSFYRKESLTRNTVHCCDKVCVVLITWVFVINWHELRFCVCWFLARKKCTTVKSCWLWSTPPTLPAWVLSPQNTSHEMHTTSPLKPFLVRPRARILNMGVGGKNVLN